MRRLSITLALTMIFTVGAPAGLSRLDTLTVGESRTGRLEAGDQQLDTGEFSDHYSFSSQPGETITIDLESVEFDTYLILVHPDGTQFDNDDRAEGDVNSQISQRLSQEGRHSLIITSYRPGETGAYTLTLHEGAPPDPDSVAEPAPEIPVTVDHTAPANLGPGDMRLHSGRYVDEYVFQGAIGHTLTIEMKSDPVDCHLTLIHPGGRRTINDDAEPGNLNSRIEITLPADGAYRLRASSYSANETGPYQISIRDTTRRLSLGDPLADHIDADISSVTYLLDGVGEELAALRVTLGGEGQTADLDLEVLCAADSPARAASRRPWVTIGASRGLGAAEEVFLGTHHRRPHLIRVHAADGEAADFTLSAERLIGANPISPTGTVDGVLAGNQRSRLHEFIAPAAGYVLVRVDAKDDEVLLRLAVPARNRAASTVGTVATLTAPVEQGDRVQVLVSAQAEASDLSSATEFRLTLHAVAPQTALSERSPAAGHVSSVAAHPIAVRRGGPLEVSLDPGAAGEALALHLLSVDTGELLGEGDSRNSVLAVAAARSECLAVVSRRGPGAPISYGLRVRAGGSVATGAIRPDEEIQGQLAADQPGGAVWRFTPDDSGIYHITMRPAAKSAALEIDVVRPGAARTLSDAPQPADEITLYARGGEDHWIRVQDPAGGTEGDFTLQVSQVSDHALAAPGDGDASELWGVFVGVSEYRSERASLPHCDDDAQNLMQAFNSHGHLSRDHAILLTNAQATHAGIAAAFEAMAERVGAEDSFVFFFSGHGGQTSESEACEEIDGRNEFICPHDTDDPQGDITDDTFAKWLAEIPAAPTMIFIDACNSGGFRDDLARVEGRVCLFASEEDLLSYTYAERKAGGIMAHVLALGFSGEADLDADGAISAGEISDYVLTEMPQIRISDSDHSSRQAQHPESNRTVPYDTVLVNIGE